MVRLAMWKAWEGGEVKKMWEGGGVVRLVGKVGG